MASFREGPCESHIKKHAILHRLWITVGDQKGTKLGAYWEPIALNTFRISYGI
jgi:hypothetical protein